jgi:small subunit ribosomal protein S6
LETAVKKLYEAMFLVDSTQASDWDAVVKTVETILGRADAEIVSIRNWAERKLAYEINRKTRGTYVLCYFRADGERVQSIEKDVQLSEKIMRVLILSAETREKEALEESSAESDSQPRKVGDESAPAKAKDKTGETKSLQKEREIKTQEDIPAAPAEEEEQKADRQAVEKVSTPQKAEEAGEPEQPAEREPADAIEPQLPAEPEAADASPAPSRRGGASESEQPEQTETEKDTTEKDVSD